VTPAVPIHPVLCIVQGRQIWLPWRSVDLPEHAVVSGRDGILWASTRSAMVARCRDAGYDAPIEEDTCFDFDEVLDSLQGEVGLSADAVINCWNMIDDIARHAAPDERSRFSVDFNGSYDRLMSTTLAGKLLQLEPECINAADRSAAAAALSGGMLMLLRMVERA